MEIEIPETTITLQEEVKYTGTKVKDVRVIDDLLSFVSIHFTFGEKTFDEILWDENTTPTYDEIGAWTNEDVVTRIKQILK